MTKLANTPGPWFATDVEDVHDRDGTLSYTNTHPLDARGLRDGRCWSVSTDPKRAGWSTDMGHSDYGLNEANARLMAAAPEMKAALRVAVATIVEMEAYNDTPDMKADPVWRRIRSDGETALRQIEAALAKAEVR